MASTTELLQLVNNLAMVGPLDRILTRLDHARKGLDELGQTELAERIREARQALLSGQEAVFQKRLAHVASRLGHLKES
jgi:hypothetical protein